VPFKLHLIKRTDEQRIAKYPYFNCGWKFCEIIWERERPISLTNNHILARCVSRNCPISNKRSRSVETFWYNTELTQRVIKRTNGQPKHQHLVIRSTRVVVKISSYFCWITLFNDIIVTKITSWRTNSCSSDGNVRSIHSLIKCIRANWSSLHENSIHYV